MHMSSESLLVILIVGLIAGWLAGQIVQGTGFGVFGDLVIGIVGAFIGDWLLPRAPESISARGSSPQSSMLRWAQFCFSSL